MRLANRHIDISSIREWLIIVLLAIYIYLRTSFLITFCDWWITLSYCAIFIIIMPLLYLLEKSIKYLKAIIISTIVFLSAWIIIYMYGYYNIDTHKSFNVTVPLKGYYLRRGDYVLFSYKGYKFSRRIRLKDALTKYGEDLPDKCELELSLCEVFPNFYYINYIDVVERNHSKN